MTDTIDHDDETRPRMLNNRQVMGYMAGHWLREPRSFWAIVVTMLLATACDLSIPWATRALINAVAVPGGPSDSAWAAWAGLSLLYLGFYTLRSLMFRAGNGFYSRIMARIVSEGFRKVQTLSLIHI